MNIILFQNGNTYASKDGQQVPHLQVSWLVMYLQFLELNRIDPTSCEITTSAGTIRPFKTDEGFWNWEITN